jgi:tRNA (5-methylaminomethyl-2-thiouridylate)-methyltransferase
MLQGYHRGATPNPDVLCNHHIKFDAFFRLACSRFQADAIATGHYAGLLCQDLGQGRSRVRLVQPRDRFKDQTYFLAGLPEAVLRHTLFPLAELAKPEVKELARAHGFAEVASQKESMGVCFIGKRAFPDFLRQYLEPQPGAIFSAAAPHPLLGGHQGSYFYTLGQCARLPGLKKKHYVVGKDRRTNAVYAAPDSEAQRMLAASEALLQFRWTDPAEAVASSYYATWRLFARCRHQGDLVACHLHAPSPPTRLPELAREQGVPASPAVVGYHPEHAPLALWQASRDSHRSRDTVLAHFGEPLHAPMPGQYVVIYSDSGLCLGSGQILAASHGCGASASEHLATPSGQELPARQAGAAIG